MSATGQLLQIDFLIEGYEIQIADVLEVSAAKPNAPGTVQTLKRLRAKLEKERQRRVFWQRKEFAAMGLDL